MVQRKRQIAIRVKPSKAKKKVTQNEVTALGRAMRALGGAGGSALGAYLGQPMAGGAIGSSLAGALSRWLGQGDYTINSNTVVKDSLKSASSIPSMHKDGQSIVVRHKEYLGEVKSSTTFSVQQSYILNPGNPITFPWLSDIASKFQEYKIRGAVFHYVPSSGSVASGTNPGLGTVMLQTTYRSTDSAPGSKVEMLNEYCANEVVPSEVLAHPVECDPAENPFNVQYVRSGTVPVGDTQLMYDLGVTHLAVSGQQATGNVIGDLWITYEVELKKPIVTSNSSFTSRNALITNTTVASSASAFLTSSTVTGNWGVTVPSNNVIQFPKGSTGVWSLTVYLNPTSTFTAWNLTGATTVANCTNVTGFTGYPASFPSNGSGATGEANGVYRTYMLQITDPGVTATITIPNFTITGAINFAQCIISQWSD